MSDFEHAVITVVGAFVGAALIVFPAIGFLYAVEFVRSLF